MECSRDLWTAALGLLKHATLTPDKSHDAEIALLSEIVVSAADRRVRLKGHDTMVEMAIDFPCDGDLEPCPVPLGTLVKLTKAGRKTKGESMSVDNIDTGLRLGIAGRSFEIARGDPQRPEGWSGVDWGSASVQSHGTAEFKAALDYCAPAISNDPTRFHLGGIYMGDDHMVATDGHRLHIARNIASFPGGAVILPSDAIAGLRAAIKQADAPWLMARHKKDGTELVQFHVEGVLLDVLITSRCIEGQFPPWDAVCPTHENGFAVDGEKWRESMQTATKLAGMESVWIAAHKECRVSIEDLFSEVMPLERRPPESVEMKFSPRYLLEAAAGADLVRVEYSGDLDAIVLRATDDHYAAVMPMR